MLGMVSILMLRFKFYPSILNLSLRISIAVTYSTWRYGRYLQIRTLWPPRHMSFVGHCKRCFTCQCIIILYGNIVFIFSSSQVSKVKFILLNSLISMHNYLS
jgi:hypothetical protein